MTARYVVGETREVLAAMPANSVDLVLTSPPFLALRSYLPADHPYKPLEIGSEPTPAAFIDTLLDVVEACSRVLAPHGSMCIELGDTYSGSGGAGGDYNPDGLREGQAKFRQRLSPPLGEGDSGPRFTVDGKGGAGWPLDKSLCLIPESFRWALVYGRNPFNGRTTPPWRARNVIRWVRPNPPVGALGDKFRPATSEMVVICKGRDRYFDLDAVRTAYKQPERVGTNQGYTKEPDYGDHVKSAWNNRPAFVIEDRGGAPPLDWWKISTQPYPGSHYATWPEQLCTTPIKAMCPLRVCVTCGKPSERITEPTEEYANRPNAGQDFLGDNHDPGKGMAAPGRAPGRAASWSHRSAEYLTLGWTDCGHNNWRTGLVLDPFAGSGTTLAVATGHGRDTIGIDLDARNADLAVDRVGPLLLTVEHHNTNEAA